MMTAAQQLRSLLGKQATNSSFRNFLQLPSGLVGTAMETLLHNGCPGSADQPWVAILLIGACCEHVCKVCSWDKLVWLEPGALAFAQGVACLDSRWLCGLSAPADVELSLCGGIPNSNSSCCLWMRQLKRLVRTCWVAGVSSQQ